MEHKINYTFKEQFVVDTGIEPVFLDWKSSVLTSYTNPPSHILFLQEKTL